MLSIAGAAWSCLSTWESCVLAACWCEARCLQFSASLARVPSAQNLVIQHYWITKNTSYTPNTHVPSYISYIYRKWMWTSITPMCNRVHGPSHKSFCNLYFFDMLLGYYFVLCIYLCKCFWSHASLHITHFYVCACVSVFMHFVAAVLVWQWSTTAHEWCNNEDSYNTCLYRKTSTSFNIEKTVHFCFEKKCTMGLLVLQDLGCMRIFIIRK